MLKEVVLRNKKKGTQKGVPLIIMYELFNFSYALVLICIKKL